MKRQLKVEVNDTVMLNQDTEVTPCVIIEEGTIGKVIEECYPYYFKVRFFENRVYWYKDDKWTEESPYPTKREWNQGADNFALLPVEGAHGVAAGAFATKAAVGHLLALLDKLGAFFLGSCVGVVAGILGSGSSSDIGLGGHIHAAVTGHGGEHRTQQEGHSRQPADAQANANKQHSNKDDQDLILRHQECLGTFVNKGSNFLHAVSSGILL